MVDADTSTLLTFNCTLGASEASKINECIRTGGSVHNSDPWCLLALSQVSFDSSEHLTFGLDRKGIATANPDAILKSWSSVFCWLKPFNEESGLGSRMPFPCRL